MRVAAVIGWSRSGKTTLIGELIRRFVARGERVAAIKHTHHPLNEESRGDTAVFLDAGAMPVILAGDREAVLFSAAPPRRVSYDSPSELLRECDEGHIVLVEGFKSFDGWPRLEPAGDVEEVLMNLDRIWRSS